MPTRRELLASSAALAAACTTGTEDSGSSNAPVDPETIDLPPPITPNELFYVVSISPWLPDEAFLAAYTLTLADADGNEVVLTLDEVRALGGTTQERTLSCIGSGSGNATGNALWTAIGLDDLLSAVGLEPDARLAAIRITGGDGYVTDLPRSDLQAGLALAYEMNGEPLPAGHGAPLRALVPGRYGMKNPKWITRIEFVEDIEPGFWEGRGWSQDAEYLVASWFYSPASGSEVSLQEGAWITGIAFAGERDISMVEVSPDNGLTWERAEIVYTGGPGVRATWQYRYRPTEPGPVNLRVRATDGDGAVQEQLEDYDADYDGLEAWDYLRLTVA
jgi:DMSO/TMAO reductase YedYZ molybdopterin-dependent catalytic subunit